MLRALVLPPFVLSPFVPRAIALPALALRAEEAVAASRTASSDPPASAPAGDAAGGAGVGTEVPAGALPEANLPARLAEAGKLLLAGRAEDAAGLYLKLLETSPRDVPAQAGRIRALILCGKWRDALAEARTFAAAQPASDALTVVLGEALYRAGQLREAHELVEPLVKAHAPAPGSTAEAPGAATSEGAPTASATKGVPSGSGESSPDPQARALLLLGMLFVAEGREDEAAGLLDRARAMAPDDRDVLFWAAGAAATRRSAIEQLERYLAISEGDDPDRIDGARGTIGLYKALGERRVWIPVSRPERIEVPLRALLDREHRPKGYVVELRSGEGKAISVLLDTGSPGLFLVERVAEGAGFSAVADQTTFAGGGEGHTPSRRGLLPTVGLGDLRFRDALVSTTTQELEPTGRYHGVLGLSFFQGYRVTLDLGRERLVAVRIASGEARSEAPPRPTIAGAPSGSSPYWTVGGQMFAQARSTDAPPALFLFDTGAVKSLVSLDLAERHYEARMGGPLDLQTFGGAMKGATTVRGVRLEFQGRTSSESRLNVADLAQRSRLTGVEVSGFIGMDLLARTVVTIDTVAQTIAISSPAKR